MIGRNAAQIDVYSAGTPSFSSQESVSVARSGNEIAFTLGGRAAKCLYRNDGDELDCTYGGRAGATHRTTLRRVVSAEYLPDRDDAAKLDEQPGKGSRTHQLPSPAHQAGPADVPKASPPDQLAALTSPDGRGWDGVWAIKDATWDVKLTIKGGVVSGDIRCGKHPEPYMIRGRVDGAEINGYFVNRGGNMVGRVTGSMPSPKVERGPTGCSSMTLTRIGDLPD